MSRVSTSLESRAEVASGLIRNLFLKVAASRLPTDRTGNQAMLLVLRVAAEQSFVGPDHLTADYDLASETGIPIRDLPAARAVAVRSGLLRYEEGATRGQGAYWVEVP